MLQVAEDGTAVLDARSVKLPEATYECLCLSAYVMYTSALNRRVANHCGYAFLTSKSFDEEGRCDAEFKHGGAGAPPALGRLRFRIVGGNRPTASSVFPLAQAARCDAMVKESSRWTEALEPLEVDLEYVHVPTLPCPFPKLPGFFFAAKTPIASEDERLFERALRAAAVRRTESGQSWSESAPLELLHGPDAACLVAESLAAVPNCNVYNEDCLVRGDGTPYPNEAFYPDARTVGDGDCEDAAREVVNLAYSLRTGVWTRPLVQRAQLVLKHYVVAEQFSAVQLSGTDSSNARYVVRKDSSLFAHAHVVFLPAWWVDEALRRGRESTPTGVRRSTARLAPWLEKNPMDVTLAQDGISLFRANPLDDWKARRVSGGDSRMEKNDTIGLEYYKLLSSCMIVDGSVVSDVGRPVFELFYSTLHHGGERYGAKFADAVKTRSNVVLRSTYELGPTDEAFARRCMSFLHPVVPYVVGADPALNALESALAPIARTVGPPEGGWGSTFFLQGKGVTPLKPPCRSVAAGELTRESGGHFSPVQVWTRKTRSISRACGFDSEAGFLFTELTRSPTGALRCKFTRVSASTKARAQSTTESTTPRATKNEVLQGCLTLRSSRDKK